MSREEFHNWQKAIFAYIDSRTNDNDTYSVYELVSALSATDVFNIFKKLNYKMYYGSAMDLSTIFAIADWINIHADKMRDDLPYPFPTDEGALQRFDNDTDNEIIDMYYCIEDFANSVQDICNIEFQEYRR